MIIRSFQFWLMLLCFTAICCNTEKSTRTMDTEPSTESQDSKPQDKNVESESKSDDERMTWQKPSEVINAMGDISDKVVVDLGAGIGYFAFKLLTKCKKVIAVDIAKDKIEILNGFKTTLNPELQAKLDTRLATVNDPNLKKGEADIILIVNTIAYLQPRVSYLENLKKFLKPSGQIFIVDYKSKRVPDYVPAPDFEERLYIHILEDQLEAAGYQNIVADDTTLEYQYIISASI